MSVTEDGVIVRQNKKSKNYILEREKQSLESENIRVTMEDIILDAGFTMVPNILIENYTKMGLQDRHIVVIITLLKFARIKRRPFPAQKTIATITGQSERTVRRVIYDLKMKGYISICKRYYRDKKTGIQRISNIYSLSGLMKKLYTIGRK